jgi:hypothetical protein
MVNINWSNEFMKLRHIIYGQHSFKAICPICGEPVTVDKSIDEYTNGDYVKQPNATCPTHGRVEMPYDGRIAQNG